MSTTLPRLSATEHAGAARRCASASTYIAAPPERVFAVVADPTKAFLTSNPFVRMELGSPKSEGVGTIYRWTFRLPFGFRLPLGATFAFEEVVTEWVPGRRCAYRATAGWDMDAATEIRPEGAGTRLTFTISYRLPWPWSWLVPGWLERLGSGRAVASVKRRAERADRALAGNHRRLLGTTLLTGGLLVAAFGPGFGRRERRALGDVRPRGAIEWLARCPGGLLRLLGTAEVGLWLRRWTRRGSPSASDGVPAIPRTPAGLAPLVGAVGTAAPSRGSAVA